MSNLNSVFDIPRGWSFGSALEYSFMPKADQTLTEGMIVKTSDSGVALKPQVEKLTSAVKAGHAYDDAWLVIRGNDQFDARFVNKVTVVKLATGVMAKVACAIANTLAPGDYVYANDGALAKVTAGAGMKDPIGQVVYTNNTAGATGWVTIVSCGGYHV